MGRCGLRAGDSGHLGPPLPVPWPILCPRSLGSLSREALPSSPSSAWLRSPAPQHLPAGQAALPQDLYTAWPGLLPGHLSPTCF